MIEAQTGVTYDIELCSGERRTWTCLGGDARCELWWRDEETGREFNESSVMYAFKLVGVRGMPTEPTKRRQR